MYHSAMSSGAAAFPLLIFIVAFVVAVERSSLRLKTTLYTFGSMAFILLLGFLITLILGPNWGAAMGTLTAPVMLLTGALAAILHSGKNRRPKSTPKDLG
jgi:hypothetical protein